MTPENYKVDEETAELDFNRFIDEMDIDADVTAMDDEDRSSFESHKRVIIRAIRKGLLIVDEDGVPTFTPARSNVDGGVTFAEPTGAMFKSTDKLKKGEDFGRLYSIMAEMTKKHPKYFSDLKNSDLKVCTAVATLFLA